MLKFFSKLTGKKPLFKPGDTPEKIGAYTIVRKIGSGATSNVYLGIHRETLKSVAIKQLSMECNSEINVQMFATEASLSGLLIHPNIVHIYEADLNAEEGAYLVLEYINGVSLDKFEKSNTLLPIDTVVDAILQSAEGLRYASKKNIVHRDVKPGNIIRTADGLVKITDFGCAITSDPNTKSIGVAGSLPYMSPEQLRDEPLTFWSDIYSLGAVFYRLLTGRYTFDAEGHHLAATQILSHPYVPLEARRQGIPKELAGVIDKALQKKPEDRFRSWGTFIRELTAARAAMSASYDYDHDLLRGFSDSVLEHYKADTTTGSPAQP